MSFIPSSGSHRHSESFVYNAPSIAPSSNDSSLEVSQGNSANLTQRASIVPTGSYARIVSSGYRSKHKQRSRSKSSSDSRSRSPSPLQGTSTHAPFTDHPPATELNILDLPIRITKQIFTFLPLEEMTTCMLVCSAWFNVLSDENMIVWKLYCRQRMSGRVLQAEYLNLCPTFKSKLRALAHSWNPHDRSLNVSVVDGFLVKRNQAPQSSDGCRAKIGFREGRHVWQLIIYDPLGSATAVGVATRSAIMTKPGYTPLLGDDRHSWGWNLVENVLYHKGDSHSYYPKNPKIKYKVGDILHVLLDCEDRTLSFKKNGDYLGVAFRDLPTPKKELFPAVCTVYGGARVSLVYLGMLSR